MSKITRAVAKIFGLDAGITQIGVFGSFAAGDPAYTSDPTEVQSLPNYLTGWFGAVAGENSPCIEDMNALCFLFAYQIAYLMQQGVAEWNSETTYYLGSFVNVDGVLYVSTQNDNLNHATTNTSWWQVLGGGIRSISSSQTQTLFDDVVLCDTSGGSIVYTFLPAAQWKGKKVTLKRLSASNSLTPTGDGSEQIDGSNTYTSMTAQYDSAMFFSDGSTIHVI